MLKLFSGLDDNKRTTVYCMIAVLFILLLFSAVSWSDHARILRELIRVNEIIGELRSSIG